MTDATEFSRTLEYWGFSLVITRLPKQWQVAIVSQDSGNKAPEIELLKGWEELEVLHRARIRVDDILELRHPRR
jgi:hypothetical protein